jgi:endonuclease/exonuclease/phosphatase (EEP) superfamily protein YafD
VSPDEGSGRRPGLARLLSAANLLYVLVLALVTAVNIYGPEETWLGSLNLYLPQWLWALPAIPLLPLTLRTGWRRIWAPLLCLLWAVGPLMGFCWRWSSVKAPANSIHLRVMTYNVKWGMHNAEAIARDVETFHPDVLQMQDSSGVLSGPLGRVLIGWNVSISGQYIIASRFPLSRVEGRNISFPGSAHHCLRATLTVQHRPITLYNVHLITPRPALLSIRHRQIDGLEANTDQRLYEVKMLGDALKAESGPLVLTGDLNAPVQAVVCRSLFAAGLRDAFSEAGRGYGYTYGQYTRLRHPYLRIDHIMVNAPWQVEDCRVGNRIGSEHIPVIADLVLPGS